MALDIEQIRSEFPILRERVHRKPLVYLDNAATTQKPSSVIEAISRYYSSQNSNVHRGVHKLSAVATECYEGAREAVRKFVGAETVEEIVFTSGATDSINLVAQSFGRVFLKEGDEILLTQLEHHSNIVPWQLVAGEVGATLRVVDILEDGSLNFEDFKKKLSPKVKLLAVGHVSNALGTINPVKEMARLAREQGTVIVIDGAQAAPHVQIDVRDIDCDFYAFSAHKMYGPTGVGVLYGKRKWLSEMPPYRGGGDMIRTVSFEKTEYNDLPYKFEAGTPNIAGVVGLHASVQFLSKHGLDNIAAHEAKLLDYATEKLAAIEGLRIVGTASRKASVISFVLKGIHPHDVGTILDKEGIAVRTGHHCAEPLMDRLGVGSTSRASFGIYNTIGEVDRLVEGIHNVCKVFA